MKENETKINQKIDELSARIDKLYALNSLLRDLDDYVYTYNYKHDEEGNLVKDENDEYIKEKADTTQNKLIDEVKEFLTKKYL